MQCSYWVNIALTFFSLGEDIWNLHFVVVEGIYKVIINENTQLIIVVHQKQRFYLCPYLYLNQVFLSLSSSFEGSYVPWKVLFRENAIPNLPTFFPLMNL